MKKATDFIIKVFATVIALIGILILLRPSENSITAFAIGTTPYYVNSFITIGAFILVLVGLFIWIEKSKD